MVRYIIEFIAASIDERELFTLFEQYYSIINFSITKQELPSLVSFDRQKTRQRTLETQIAALLTDGKPWPRKAIVAYFSAGYRPLAIDRALEALVKSNTIGKEKHGVYLRQATNGAADRTKPRASPAEAIARYNSLLDLLQEPHTIAALSGSLGVSKQRIRQMLAEPLKIGTVQRLDMTMDGVRKPHYVKAGFAKIGTPGEGSTRLKTSEAQVLSTLAIDILTPSKLIAEITGFNDGQLRRAIMQLKARGLLDLYKIGLQQFLKITKAGLEHEQYSQLSKKAGNADLLKQLGQYRCAILTLLATNGPAKAQVLRALARDQFSIDEHITTGAAIRSLQGCNLIEKTGPDENFQPIYRLTRKGQVIAGYVSAIASSPESKAIQIDS